MRFATNRVPVLAQVLCTLVLGCAALLGLPTSASAGTILIFGQTVASGPTADFVNAAFSGNTATLTTVGVSNPASTTSIPILVTQVDGISIPAGLAAWETFSPSLTSSTPQSGIEKAGFSGTITISSLPDGGGTNILTSSFSGDGFLTVPPPGGSGGLSVPGGVTYTSNFAPVIAALAGNVPATNNLSLAFANIVPTQSDGFTSFTAQNSGVFASSVIPEPASVVMMGLGLLGVLGYGSLRHKTSKA